MSQTRCRFKKKKTKANPPAIKDFFVGLPMSSSSQRKVVDSIEYILLVSGREPSAGRR